MIDFKNRSPEKELLDSGGIPFPDIRKNMQELEFINSKLGGHSVTVSGVERMFRAHFSNDHSLPLTVCEIGCGGGDNLAAVCRWAKKSIDISCIRIDINLACIDFATEKNAEHPISFVCADYRKGLEGKARPDIIFSSLFCHHFSEDELVDMLQWMKGNAGTGFMINDLHRHPLAYFSIKILTGIFPIHIL